MDELNDEFIISQCYVDDVMYVELAYSPFIGNGYVTIRSRISDGENVSSFEKNFASKEDALSDYLDLITRYIKASAKAESEIFAA